MFILGINLTVFIEIISLRKYKRKVSWTSQTGCGRPRSGCHCWVGRLAPLSQNAARWRSDIWGRSHTPWRRHGRWWSVSLVRCGRSDTTQAGVIASNWNVQPSCLCRYLLNCSSESIETQVCSGDVEVGHIKLSEEYVVCCCDKLVCKTNLSQCHNLSQLLMYY